MPCIACAFTEEGQLEVMQVSEGPLTYWCFEESPHYVSTMFDREAIEGMLAYFHVEDDSRPAAHAAGRRMSGAMPGGACEGSRGVSGAYIRCTRTLSYGSTGSAFPVCTIGTARNTGWDGDG